MAGSLIDVATARERVLAATAPLPAEEVDLGAALGRVLAEDVAADGDLPPFDASAMDGFAVRAGGPEELVVVDESRAGHPAATAVEPGAAIRISTGAELPAGAEAVVPVERTEQPAAADGRPERVRVPERRAGANVRRAGEDVRAGQVVLRAGTPLGPAEVAVLAAVGRARVCCGGRPRVAVVVTGDELVEPGMALGPGQIRDSNLFALAAQAAAAGGADGGRTIVRDDLASTVAALGRAIETADVVCVSGGVSVGPHDHVKPALAELGVEERFWGVALKPGKPTWFGIAPSGTLVFGLPGNPVSAMVTFHLFARPALRRLQGAEPVDVRIEAVLDEPVARSPAREQAIRCTLAAAADGWHVRPTREQGSHILTSMLGAGALAVVPPGEGELPAGTRVQAELLAASR